jgi:hypothetical protein
LQSDIHKSNIHKSNIHKSNIHQSDILQLQQIDIFLSHAKEDRQTAQMLADALAQRKWFVWWDKDIPPGRTFDTVIEAAIGSAKCVVVMWSAASVSSNWVKEEADEGTKRGILVPVLIENVTIPMGFRHIQAANLIDWTQSRDDHPGFRTLIASIDSIVANPPLTTVPGAASE